MHHNEDPNRRAPVVSCYLDESATDGGMPTAAVGGALFNQPDYLKFDGLWQSFLHDCGLQPALHMKDFGRHGRFSAMTSAELCRVFRQATKLIEDHRIYSLSATLRHDDYREIFSEETRSTHSPYEFCFILAALANGKMAQLSNYQERIAFVMDQGNRYAEHVRLAHAEMKGLNSSIGFPTNIGSLTFADDEDVSALQAADVICWGARRKAEGSSFREGMETIADLINEESGKHQTIPMDREAMEELEQYFSGRAGCLDAKGSED